MATIEPDRAWLLPLLKQVRLRPGMYFGHENTTLLWQFLAGYCQARLDLGATEFGKGEPDHLMRFTLWLKSKHGFHDTTHGWNDIIERLDGSERNLGTFFLEFEGYLRDSGISFEDIPGKLPDAWLLDR